MQKTIEVLEKASDLLSECLTEPEHVSPYIKQRIDSTQELLLDLLCDLKEQ